MRRVHILKKNEKAKETLITVNAKCYNASTCRSKSMCKPGAHEHVDLCTADRKEGLVLLVVNSVKLHLTALHVHKDTRYTRCTKTLQKHIKQHCLIS